MLEELYIFQSNGLPRGGSTWHLCRDLLETGNIGLDDMDSLFTVASDNVNILLKSKFHRGSKFSSDGSSTLKVQVRLVKGNIEIFNATTGENMTGGFLAQNERVVLYLSIVHAIRVVGSEECRRSPFVYDTIELFDMVEYLDHQDFKDFLDSKGSIGYEMQWRNSPDYGRVH